MLFFGPARDWAGVDSSVFDIEEGATLAQLKNPVAERHPGIKEGMTCVRFAVNQEFAADDATLHDGDEVALIPPVSGGCD